MKEVTILRLPQVVAKTGISRSRIYEYMRREIDAFPQPVKIGIRSVGWRLAEVDEWLETRERAGTAKA